VRAFVKGEGVLLALPSSCAALAACFGAAHRLSATGQRLFAPDGAKFAKAWNFGPDTGGDATVGEIAEITARLWGEGARVECAPSPENPHEAGLLRLDSTLARTELGWKPRWPLDQALAQTVAWYRAWTLGADMAAFSLDQIRAYEAAGQS
jgi:CDP-glucose 4,6-dehydratase